ncbi:MAG TPA: hypothetical protein ENN73_07170, partial [Firmicutes bacterium]|nr:hypothetical protein [Bacillota bacterium]
MKRIIIIITGIIVLLSASCQTPYELTNGELDSVITEIKQDEFQNAYNQISKIADREKTLFSILTIKLVEKGGRRLDDEEISRFLDYLISETPS